MQKLPRAYKLQSLYVYSRSHIFFPRNFVPFRSVPSFGIGSSAELGMPRKEHFLPRNSGNHSESIPRIFFGTKFRSQPYSFHAPKIWCATKLMRYRIQVGRPCQSSHLLILLERAETEVHFSMANGMFKNENGHRSSRSQTYA